MAVKPILVVGGGGHAKVILGMLLRLPAFRPVGYVDPKGGGSILGMSCLGGDDAIPSLVQKHPGLQAVIGVGKIRSGGSRVALADRLKGAGLELPVIIAPSATVASSAIIGEGSVVMDGVVIQPDCRVGRLGIVNTGATLDHDCILGADVHVAPGATLSGGVSVGEASMIGVGASVLQYLSVGRDVTVGAGAVVVSDCKEPGVYIGVPARRAE